MRKRRANYRLVKIHRNYTVAEAAELFGTHRGTVRAWIKAGLPAIDDRRPIVILGRALFAFLKARREKNRQTCQPWEIYCVRCREPRRPAGNMADYRPISEKLGNLEGICPDCGAMIYQRTSRAKLPTIQGKLDIRFTRRSDE